MGINGLPGDFEQWATMRQVHLHQDLKRSNFTDDLFGQYRKHLGAVRYRILQEAQTLVVPETVRQLLGYRKTSLLHPLLAIYKITRKLKMDWLLKAIVLPAKHKDEIAALDATPDIASKQAKQAHN